MGFEYDDIDLIGERAHTIKKAFNIREGWTREDDTLPYRWMNEPMTKGPSAGHFTRRRTGIHEGPVLQGQGMDQGRA